MLIEVLLFPIMLILREAINMIPIIGNFVDAPDIGLSALIEIIGVGFYIFPAPLFFYFIANVTLWLGIQMLWAIIEWVYNKIPGIN